MANWKSKTYTQNKQPLDKNKSSKLCKSVVKQRHFQTLKKEWHFHLYVSFIILSETIFSSEKEVCLSTFIRQVVPVSKCSIAPSYRY